MILATGVKDVKGRVMENDRLVHTVCMVVVTGIWAHYPLGGEERKLSS